MGHSQLKQYQQMEEAGGYPCRKGCDKIATPQGLDIHGRSCRGNSLIAKTKNRAKQKQQIERERGVEVNEGIFR